MKDFTSLKVLDLFCGGGGVAVGLYQAGLRDITGIDIEPQGEYPFNFFQADVFELEPHFFRKFDFFWASPPCQAYSLMTQIPVSREQKRGNPEYSPENLKRKYPKLIKPTRELLLKLGKPFVIENVVGAPLRKDLLLCGTMFNLDTFRHRVFEIHKFLIPQHYHPTHRNRVNISVRTKSQNKEEPLEVCQNALGIDWITNFKTLGEAIPPAYSRYIASEFLKFRNGKGQRPLLDYVEVKC